MPLALFSIAPPAGPANTAHTRTPLDLKMRNITLLNRPNIDIELNRTEGVHGDYVTSFVTLDKIEGTVRITPKHDMKFDSIEIAFIGIAKTFVDRLSAAPSLSGRAEAKHRFLRLVQPMNPEQYPNNRVLQSGQKYSFPFEFVVPDRLLPRACPHVVLGDHVREQHLQLPPSLGDAELSGYGGKLLDDLSPDMAGISYMIRATILRNNKGVEEDDEDFETAIVDKIRKIRIKPAFDEQPPLPVLPAQDEWSLRAERPFRRSILRPKNGTLVMESGQPSALVLPHRNPEAPVTTMVRVNLRFDPVDPREKPPCLGRLQSKLKAVTFFASSPRHVIPVRADTQSDVSQGYHAETVSLSSRNVASVSWEMHSGSLNSSMQRRDSTLSTDMITDLKNHPAPSSTYDEAKCPIYHVAHILVPVTLPLGKHFVPTFHNCLISRTYAIALQLYLQSPKATPAQSLSLRVPVQITQEGSPERDQARRESLRDEEVEMELEEVFEPRLITVVGDDVLGRNEALSGARGRDEAQDQPPDYAVFGGSGTYTRNAGYGVQVAG